MRVMIETDRLKIYVASKEQMEADIVGIRHFSHKRLSNAGAAVYDVSGDI